MNQTTPGDAPPPTDHESPYDDGPPYGDGPRVGLDDIKDLGRIRRSTTDKKLAGVAGGLARHLDIDPVVVRIAFVVLAFFGGGGLLLYAAGWLFVPDERTDQATVNVDDRSRTVILAIAGVLAALAVVGDTLGGFGGFPWPLAVIAVVAIVVISTKQHGHRHGGPWAAVTDGPAAADTTGPDAESAAADSPTERTAEFAGAEATDAHGAGGQAGPRGPAYAGYWPRPVDPRRRGPLLFWFTAALALVGVGVLASLQLAGVDVPVAAYPATALAACGLMLAVGAFYGRAGGLILVGLVALLATGVSSLAVPTDGVFLGQLQRSPDDLSELDDAYAVTMGDLKLDLTDVDLAATEDHTLELDVLMANAEIYVPEGLTVVGEADVELGEARAFDERGSTGTVTFDHEGDPDAPVLTIDASVTMGNLKIMEVE